MGIAQLSRQLEDLQRELAALRDLPERVSQLERGLASLRSEVLSAEELDPIRVPPLPHTLKEMGIGNA